MGIGQSRIKGFSVWGNGAAMARALSQNGVKLVGCDPSLEAAQFSASRLREEGGACGVMTANVPSSADVRSVVEAAMQQYGCIEILVNNVGMTWPGNPARIPEEP
ncbi:hypothetical protein DPSP01_011922 [Paraphaeosphaeria sporulosa]|uniref:3-oxoacyl-[acyl-carrier-protein] reductase n=1 Tax=Paraphaeosphaeria sporulosa TaxID=1460663 RepID=A0A177CTF9_9PLEO|nr:uncharacterized protein CC84DRAFT_1255944 [Paraphaeosphaeria sporulosa]OAG10039.1 hypothetical protein CC84DRAFT_1255944 [Paraphaeosphaeria sporulosa]